jgi:protein CpxP
LICFTVFYFYNTCILGRFTKLTRKIHPCRLLYRLKENIHFYIRSTLMKFKTSLLLAALAFLPGLAAAQQFPPTESGPMAGPDAGQSRPMMMDQRHPEGMGQEKPPMPHGGPLEAMPGALPEPIWLHGIKLSEDQEEQLFKILYAQLPTLHEQTKNLRHAHEALRTAPFSDKYDAAKVKNLSDAISHAIATLS